jgi:hypothetical protein
MTPSATPENYTTLTDVTLNIPFGEATMWGDYHMREVALYVQRIAENGPYITFFGP